jgi:hypothetical protein
VIRALLSLLLGLSLSVGVMIADSQPTPEPIMVDPYDTSTATPYTP